MVGYYRSPIGVIKVVAFTDGILGLQFMNETVNGDINLAKRPENSKMVQLCIDQLDEYFTGKRKIFDIPISQHRNFGTEFQELVWQELQNIPYGETRSYAQIAELIGHSNSYRAVGTANGKNNIPIIIPCHRVIGANGKLSGYAFGTERKQWLLDHEKKYN